MDTMSAWGFGSHVPGTLPTFSFMSATPTRTSSRTSAAMALPSMSLASARADFGSARAGAVLTAPRVARSKRGAAEALHPRVVAAAAATFIFVDVVVSA
jgi:hypothetical protein